MAPDVIVPHTAPRWVDTLVGVTYSQRLVSEAFGGSVTLT